MKRDLSKNYIDLPLDEWQKRECKGCFFADDKKVGTKKACCTYTDTEVFDCLGHCKTRRNK